jgi:peptide chain release factor 1
MTESAVQLTHKPSGLSVRIESERSQSSNKMAALALLRARLQRRLDDEADARRSEDRKAKVGSGMRGDKVRTIRVQDGIVSDHRSGKKIALRAFLRGDLAGLR